MILLIFHSLLDITVHKLFVKLRSESVIDKALLLVLVHFGAILKHHIVVPSLFDLEINSGTSARRLIASRRPVQWGPINAWPAMTFADLALPPDQCSRRTTRFHCQLSNKVQLHQIKFWQRSGNKFLARKKHLGISALSA